ncbi:RNA dependent RNA polymerase-domain-containing protein [Neohortaea acidophila]|uniref:RNA-dependent RNA polymerase n=1 Tax=Neohortaea acidophila TaxID=245834 RepID=A0A6A6PZR6_9PEZI|nr:RNA dependent RNA polymerase-domain-containing protein [Neohortaea acidophila]KAF2485512.1 RNA dependent RNA polymerase-domain-containing protein [Neohortaea acidophila]
MSRSGMARPPDGPRPSSSLWLHRAANATEALASFGTESKISFPTGLMSPARTHKSTEQQIREKFSSLFYIDRPTLELEITDFLTYPANVWSDPNERLKYLLGKLENAVKGTPRRLTRSATMLARTQSAQKFQEVLDDPNPPDSTSMSVKHGPKISAAEFGKIELPMPMSQPTGLVSANTSFSSHASFWSNAHNSSQSAGTPASSMGTPMEIDGACGKSTPDSEFPMSSMTAEAFREALNDVQSGRNETAVDSPSSYKTPFESPSDYKSPLGSGSSSGRKRSREVDDSPFAPGRATKAQAMDLPYPAFSNPQQPPESAAEVQTPPRTAAAGQAQAPLLSPARTPAVNHRVRDIPVHGLSSIELPPSFLKLRFDLRLEAYRVLQTGKILPGALEMQWRTPRTMEKLHELTDRLGIQYQHGFKTDFSDATLCARLRWGEDPKGPLLRLEFLPPRKERSSELQRKWGSTRFLYVDSVDPGRPPKGISGKDVRERFVQMLTNEHSLLGNKYKLFFARDISITPSQTKIHRSVLSDDDLTTFNVNRFKMSAKPSVLYSGFLPILQHGGVPSHVIHEHVRKSVEMLVDSFEEALKSPVQFRQWLSVQNEIHQTANRELGIETVAGFPVLMSEKIYQMLESGFEPTKCRFLADEIATLMTGVFNLKMKNFKIPYARSTSLMGTVDTSGLVKPGEVHISFSTTFVDAVSGERSSSWHGMAALVARNPARRPSDIRKLRIVSHPDLSHLTDVAVFSSLGPQPEGSKMQGGDYDGDTYWICVESKIVDSFQNSPAPRESELPDISELLIEKDGALVRDIISIPESDGAALDEDEVAEWIRSNLRTISRPSGPST